MAEGPEQPVAPVDAMMIGRIGTKLIGAVGLAVTIGLVSLVAFYASSQEDAIRAHNERTMRNVTQSVIESLQTVMLAGYADIAQIFADRLKTVQGVIDFRIVRIDGNEAFRDNRTIDEVNRRRGEEIFTPRDQEEVVPVIAADDAGFRNAIDNRAIVAVYDANATGEQFLTFLAPIVNGEKCHKCHGSNRPIRGVLKLTTSLAPMEADIAAARRQALIILGIAILVIMAAAVVLVRRSLLRPISAISDAMAGVSRGRLDGTVPVFGKDELGQMADSFNHMTEELRRTLTGFALEQDKLTTIILSADEGMVVTDSAGRVVLVNPAAERILDKPAAAIVADGFDALFGDTRIMRQWIEVPGGTKNTLYQHGEKLLNVTAATIAAEGGGVLGSAALFRDVTETKRMEQELRRRSFTDALTGLGNRRYLDQSLEREVLRTTTHDNDLSIMMFDIDHFKRFNDTFGHDQGDRVLKAVADAIRTTVRGVDIPCRYGGEEFLVILRSTARDGAVVIAERLRANVEAMVVDGQKVTISVGVACYRDVVPANPAAFVEAADKALYAAKHGGRNRVVVAEAVTAKEFGY
jgi:diguanylate cyclase (GGDEF)-like protein